jgi:hypothetical protein
MALILIGFDIAIPLCYYSASMWLKKVAYHIDPGCLNAANYCLLKRETNPSKIPQTETACHEMGHTKGNNLLRTT